MGGSSDGGGVTDADPMRPDVFVAPVTSIRIEPERVELVVRAGERPTQDFDVIGVRDDGSELAIGSGVTWAIDTRAIGELDLGSGVFSANGVIGGAARVLATVSSSVGELRTNAEIIVRLERELVGAGVPADVEARFAAPVADDARRANLVYPLDGAVMPQNVYPADVQWTRGVEGDLFRITLAKPSVRVVAYLVHGGAGFGSHWLVDAEAWRALAQTEPDARASITVDRWEAATGEAIAGTPREVLFARAALTGSVYYWDIQRGRIVRIDDGTATPNEFMPAPPTAMDGASCVGCHSVSNSGRYMAGRLGGGENIGAVFDLTTDLTATPAPSIFPLQTVEPTSTRWWFSAWSPDDTRLVLSSFEGTGPAGVMRFMDPITGALIPVTGTLPTNITQPDWSPDGTRIAYVTNANAWGGAFTTGDIGTLDVTGPDTFGASRVIHAGTSLAGSSPPGNADSYPSWAPDSRHIAFAHGSGTRSEDQQSALYVMGRDGAGVVRLDAANGPSTTNFQPRFSPFDQGGYFWLSFLSRRDYGNAEVGTAGTDFQQVWVTAIRKDAPPGTDPSSPPYWISGQRTTSRNISAFWAPRPCRPDGESCSVGSECCGGDCRPDASGALVCSPPPPDRCRNDGETCSSTEDCCEGLECVGRVCLRPPS